MVARQHSQKFNKKHLLDEFGDLNCKLLTTYRYVLFWGTISMKKSVGFQELRIFIFTFKG